jgi:class 3 adenylate cyclase
MSTTIAAIIMLSVGAPALYCLARHLWAMRVEMRERALRAELLAVLLRRMAVLAGVVVVIVSLFSLLTLHGQESMTVETLVERARGQGVSLDEVRQMGPEAWRVADPLAMPTISLEDEHHWLRVPIPPTGSETEYVAQLHFILLESVEFAVVRGDAVREHAVFGPAVARGDEEHLGGFPSFAFRVDAASISTLYVRIAGKGVKVFPLSVAEKPEHARRSIQATLLKGLALGCLLGILLYNLSLYFALRDLTYLLYAGYQLTLLAVLLAYSSLLPAAVATLMRLAGSMQTLINALIFITVMAFTHFYISFMDLSRKHSWQERTTRALGFASLTALLLLPAMGPILQFVVCVSLLTLMCISSVTALMPRISKRYVFRFMIGIVGLFACAFVHVLSLFNILPANVLSDQVVYLGAVWDGIFVSLAIAARVGEIEVERDTLLRSLSEKGQSLPAGAARSMHVSIMFVDVANFALIADRVGSVTVYRALSRRMQEIRQIVAELNGTVDRSLGDGLLCFFAADEGESAAAHATRAFQAALRIQQLTLKAPAEENGKAGMLLPLRIGLHADEVLIGNLGGLDRVDFTMIGKGVELTHRLEAAASPFKIVVSKEFRGWLGDSEQYRSGFHHLYTPINFHEGLLEAYEYNPFAASPEDLVVAERGFVESLGISSRDPRIRFVNPGTVSLKSSYGTFRVKDLSLHGMGVIGDAFIGRRAVISVTVKTFDALATARLTASHLESLQVEVRWCRENGGKFEHGFRIVGLNAEQKQALLTVLSQMEGAMSSVDDGRSAPRRETA